MDIYMLCSNNNNPFAKSDFRIGRFSYIANGDRIFCEKHVSDPPGDMMVIFVREVCENMAPMIYDECKRMKYSSVFLDIETSPSSESQKVVSEICTDLALKKIKIFCPLAYAAFCREAIPVADARISGGNFKEYLMSLFQKHKRLALSFFQSQTEFSMPPNDFNGRDITMREFKNILSVYEPSCFYSPGMMTNYTIFSDASDSLRYILFDDAQTISRKLRLAKQLRADTAFFVFDNIHGIINEIEF